MSTKTTLSRRRFLLGAFGLGASAVAASVVWERSRLTDVAGQHVIALTPHLINTYLVRGPRGAVLVDTGTPDMAEAIGQALRAHGVERGALDLIMITHAHGDHFGSALRLRDAFDAPLAATAYEAGVLATGRSPQATPLSALGHVVALQGAGQAADHGPIAVDVLLEDGQRLDAYGIAARVAVTPGHTPGLASVVLDSGDALVADLMGADLIRPDRPDWPFFGEDPDAIRASLQRLLAAGVERFHVGHGLPFARAAAQAWLDSGQASGVGPPSGFEVTARSPQTGKAAQHLRLEDLS